MDQNINFDNIKAQASSWSLQGDADMLECLVKFSQVNFNYCIGGNIIIIFSRMLFKRQRVRAKILTLSAWSWTEQTVIC